MPWFELHAPVASHAVVIVNDGSGWRRVHLPEGRMHEILGDLLSDRADGACPCGGGPACCRNLEREPRAPAHHGQRRPEGSAHEVVAEDVVIVTETEPAEGAAPRVRVLRRAVEPAAPPGR
jgi:hypothetical protein